MKEPPIFELENWRKLITGPEWQAFLKLVKEHREYLNKEMGTALDKENFNDAMRFRACYKDMDKLATLIDKRVNELVKLEEGGE